MVYKLLADLLLLVHLAFIIFVIFGGFLAIKNVKWAWLHVPKAVWGGLDEFAGWICPLTHLENWLQIKGGRSGYHGDFIANYIIPIVYPANLTRQIQLVLAAVVIIFNVLVYGYVLFLRRKA